MMRPSCVLDGADITALIAKNGLSFTAETIWSQNTGRSTSTGTMVGDIIAVKYTVRIKFRRLRDEEFRTVWNLVAGTTPFHQLDFPVTTGSTGSTKRIRCYIAPPSAGMEAWYVPGHGWYEDFEIECIEK